MSMQLTPCCPIQTSICTPAAAASLGAGLSVLLLPLAEASPDAWRVLFQYALIGLVAIPVAQILAAIPGLPGGWGVGDLAFFLCLPAVGVPPGQAVALFVTYCVAHTVISLPWPAYRQSTP